MKSQRIKIQNKSNILSGMPMDIILGLSPSNVDTVANTRRQGQQIMTLCARSWKGLITELNSGDGAPLELWFRSMVHERWLLYLDTQAQSDAFQQQTSRLAEDLDGCVESFCPA